MGIQKPSIIIIRPTLHFLLINIFLALLFILILLIIFPYSWGFSNLILGYFEETFIIWITVSNHIHISEYFDKSIPFRISAFHYISNYSFLPQIKLWNSCSTIFWIRNQGFLLKRLCGHEFKWLRSAEKGWTEME